MKSNATPERIAEIEQRCLSEGYRWAAKHIQALEAQNKNQAEQIDDDVQHIAELEADKYSLKEKLKLYLGGWPSLEKRIAELEADYKECYQCCTEETIRANEAEATIQRVKFVLDTDAATATEDGSRLEHAILKTLGEQE